MPEHRQNTGTFCELLVQSWLVDQNYWVFTPVSGTSPIDVVAISENNDLLLIDAKTENWRFNPGKKSPSRIYRTRSSVQKKLGVRIAYVNDQSGLITLVPSLEKKKPHQINDGA